MNRARLGLLKKLIVLSVFPVVLLTSLESRAYVTEEDKRKMSEFFGKIVDKIRGIEQKKPVVYSIQQNKYKDDNNGHLNIDAIPTTLYPLHGNNSHKNKKIRALPFIIVLDAEYNTFIKNKGLSGRPENHIDLNGKEVVVLKSGEVDTNYRNYSDSFTNFVKIDGQYVKFVDQETYQSEITKYPHVKNMPANYIRIGQMGIVVLVIKNDEEETGKIFPSLSESDGSKRNNRKTKQIGLPSGSTSDETQNRSGVGSAAVGK
jgi:uncharacterized protein (UPF0305 family)